MKKIIFIVFALFALNMNAQSQHVLDSVKVYGNCGLCKDRIEGAVKKMNGIHKAEWSIDSTILVVEFDKTIVDIQKIQQELANVGHDTRDFRASDKAYKNLHTCCKYERPQLVEESNSIIKTFNFQITGMTCSEGCAKGIESALYKQKGVKSSVVNFDTQKAKVIYDSSKITKEKLISIVENFNPEGESKMTYKVIEK